MMAVKIVAIWLLSMVLAVPEAISFDMTSFNYRNTTINTCMLQPKTPFIAVSVCSTWACECRGRLHVSWVEQQECVCVCACVLFVFSEKCRQHLFTSLTFPNKTLFSINTAL